ncbi:TIGR02301 family protein [Xanthobacter variabilis]|uniref:TIGR02301 family protein n=1 Tax=Xanthobacter variabilis TaxID=3119932 RepID=UPI0037268872
MRSRSLIVSSLLVSLALPPALAVGLVGVAGPLAAAPSAEGAAPPYDDDLLKLAEILGGLHYLRPLCGASGEAQRWRDEMAALIETEQPSDARKGKMIASFNRGYSSFAEVYRTCTPAARTAVARQLEEASHLAHEIVVRYGGN